MAARTLQTEVPSVDSRFLVTALTIARGGIEAFPGVTTLAGQGSVFAFQREDLRVGETAHAIGSIVALQAILTILGAMLLHKIGFRSRVASDACRIIES
ncbi:MAG: hypothetical protein PHQ40_01420 [Anaerolineaceae bacterium]|nr:hypothetical protein [Anaerolineaceae bacterium]